MINIKDYKFVYLSVAAILVMSAVVAIGVLRFKEGVDFTGGTLWQLQFNDTSISLAQVESLLKDDLKISQVQISFEEGNKSFLARLPEIAEVDHQKFLSVLKAKHPALQEFSFQSIGPSVSRDLRNRAMLAIAFVLIGISLYIAFAFRKVSRPIASWHYGWITLATLFHDVVIPAGVMAVLGHVRHTEIDTNFVVALLVVMGFSVHDTIVVFDRIRENLSLTAGKIDFASLVNSSVNQTLARSINTSLTLVFVLIALLVAGPQTLFSFILTLLIGVTTGIYSSVFVASPMLLVLYNRIVKEK